MRAPVRCTPTVQVEVEIPEPEPGAPVAICCSCGAPIAPGEWHRAEIGPCGVAATCATCDGWQRRAWALVRVRTVVAIALLAALTACSGSGGGGFVPPPPGSPGSPGSPGGSPAPLPPGQTAPQGTQLVALSGKPVRNRLVYESADPSNRAVTDADGRFVLPRAPSSPIATNVSDQEPVIVRARSPLLQVADLLLGTREASAAANEYVALYSRDPRVPVDTPLVLGFAQPEAIALNGNVTSQSRQTADLCPAIPGEEWVRVFADFAGNRRTQVLGAAGMILDVPFSFAEPLAVGDLNGDGHPDLFDGTRIVLGDGAGGFAVAGDIPSVFTVALVDLDEDGALDLVSADDDVLAPAPYVVRVRFGDGAGGFGGTVDATALPAAAKGGLATGDLDGDGHQDVSAATSAGAFALLGDGDGAFPRSRSLNTGRIAGDISSLAFGDVDGDGVGEVVMYRPVTGIETRSPLIVARQDGSTDALFVPSIAGRPSLILRDLDRDGIKDALIYSEAGQLNVALSVSGVGPANVSTYQEPGFTTFPGGISGSPLVGDLDGDAVADFAPAPGRLLRGR